MGTKSVELFAGAGGLALGTARAGFEHVAVTDWDENACQTLERNKRGGVEHVRDWHILQGDIREISVRDYVGKVDYVFGGPPCQPFSPL